MKSHSVVMFVLTKEAADTFGPQLDSGKGLRVDFTPEELTDTVYMDRIFRTLSRSVTRAVTTTQSN